MPEFRPDLHTIARYRPGKPIDEVMRELGLSEVIKLASNEFPLEPFPEVIEAIAAEAHTANRYPESSSHYLRQDIAAHYDIQPDNVLVGAGSSQLILLACLALGGADRSIMYADPSFSMYPIGTRIAHSTPIEIPLDTNFVHDIDAMLGAIQPNTKLVMLCNPNNPTGTYLPLSEIQRFIDNVSNEVLVIVDEAYAEFATAPDFDTAVPLAIERSNVVVGRTFSKIYGIAGLRVGYFIGQDDALSNLARVQPPFSVTQIAQVAAREALRHPDRLQQRIDDIAFERARLTRELASRGLKTYDSQANFVLVEMDTDVPAFSQRMLAEGIILRTFGPFVRVSVGATLENTALLKAWDTVTG